MPVSSRALPRQRSGRGKFWPRRPLLVGVVLTVVGVEMLWLTTLHWTQLPSHNAPGSLSLRELQRHAQLFRVVQIGQDGNVEEEIDSPHHGFPSGLRQPGSRIESQSLTSSHASDAVPLRGVSSEPSRSRTPQQASNRLRTQRERSSFTQSLPKNSFLVNHDVAEEGKNNAYKMRNGVQESELITVRIKNPQYPSSGYSASEYHFDILQEGNVVKRHPHEHSHQSKALDGISSLQHHTHLVDSRRRNEISRDDVDALLDSRGLYLITWYNIPFWHMDTAGTEIFDRCDVKCYVSQNASHAYVSDVVIINDENVPGGVPPRRAKNQVWVFFTLEAPPHVHTSNLEDPSWRHQINWTMTYRMDSDLPLPYGRLVRRSSAHAHDWTAVLAGKRKMAVWVVSHCVTHSLREKYVRALQEHIPVDVLGHCPFAYGPCSDTNADDCFEEIFTEYKFFLSFENSLCRDYITEKFYRSQARNIVNVIRGGRGSRERLKKGDGVVATFPQGTFIDAGDFQSAFHLAQYLRYLDRNDTAYVEYLRRKAWYDVEFMDDVTAQAFCNMCRRLHRTTERKSYPDVIQWYSDQACHNPASDMI